MTTADYAIHNQDCIPGMAEHLAPESVDLCVTSIPYGALFMYSGKTEDIGNNADGIDMRASHFGLHMRFAIEQLYRVMAPGSVVCIQIQQLITTKVQHGHMGRRDLRAAVVDLFGAGGFNWTGETVIAKNPQAMAQRMKLHSLLFQTGKRDARALAPAMNDIVLQFRKPGQGKPVPALYDPEKNPGGWVSTDEWIRDASGVWSDIRETDVLTGTRDAREPEDERHVCLAAGSLVLTRDGYIPIEAVEVGAEVLTHRGRWRPVVARSNNGRRPVVCTEAQGVASLRTTPDHPLFVRSGIGTGGGTSHPRQNAMRADPGWLRADGTLGSYLNLPTPPVAESAITAAECWIIGRWLGDGHRHAAHRRSGKRGGVGQFIVTCAHDEATGLIERLGAHAGCVTARETATQITLRDLSPAARAALDRCGAGAAGKRVPGELLSLDQERTEALLSGYLSADGHYVAEYDRWIASSVSRALLLGMALIAQRARGVVASVYAGRPPRDHVIASRNVSARQEWVLCFRNAPGYRQSGWVGDDGAWKKVRRIDDAGEDDVWDLQVADDESFVAEGCVVHNCPIQLELVRRCVRLWSNPGDLVLDPFMGVGSVAVVALEQGRRAVGFELKESYWRQALANCELEIRRQEVSQEDLFSLAGIAV